jgi:hypothetical protein
MTENYSKRLELIQIRLKEHFLPSFSPTQLVELFHLTGVK